MNSKHINTHIKVIGVWIINHLNEVNNIRVAQHFHDQNLHKRKRRGAHLASARESVAIKTNCLFSFYDDREVVSQIKTNYHSATIIVQKSKVAFDTILIFCFSFSKHKTWKIVPKMLFGSPFQK